MDQRLSRGTFFLISESADTEIVLKEVGQCYIFCLLAPSHSDGIYSPFSLAKSARLSVLPGYNENVYIIFSYDILKGGHMTFLFFLFPTIHRKSEGRNLYLTFFKSSMIDKHVYESISL